MTERTEHLDERLDEWIDGRLDLAGRAAVELHLRSCPECRARAEGLRELRTALHERLADDPAPARLQRSILAALDREDEARAIPSVPPPPAAGPLRTFLPLAAGLALAVIAATFVLRPAERHLDVVSAAFREHAQVSRSGLDPALAAGDAATIEARWREGELDFPARVLDLSAMEITLVGGDATELGGEPAARSVYAGPMGRIVCWMFRAGDRDLPPPVEVRSERGFLFRVYQRGRTTLVVWREGDVLCALAATADRETVLGLAIAKAMAPPASGEASRETGDAAEAPFDRAARTT